MPRPTARIGVPPACAAPAALVLVATLLAACGPGGNAAATPAGAQTFGPPATTAPVPTLPPLPSLDPSFVIPTFKADLALEALLPDEIAGVPTVKSSMLGPSMIGTGASGDDLRAVLEQFDKSPDDLSVAFTSGAGLSLSAYRIKGLDAGAAYVAFLALLDLEEIPAVSDDVIGGKPVKKLVTATTTAYVYTHEDVIFTIAPSALTSDEVLADAVSQLP